jgi:hypothetical protein
VAVIGHARDESVVLPVPEIEPEPVAVAVPAILFYNVSRFDPGIDHARIARYGDWQPGSRQKGCEQEPFGHPLPSHGQLLIPEADDR